MVDAIKVHRPFCILKAPIEKSRENSVDEEVECLRSIRDFLVYLAWSLPEGARETSTMRLTNWYGLIDIFLISYWNLKSSCVPYQKFIYPVYQHQGISIDGQQFPGRQSCQIVRIDVGFPRSIQEYIPSSNHEEHVFGYSRHQTHKFESSLYKINKLAEHHIYILLLLID